MVRVQEGEGGTIFSDKKCQICYFSDVDSGTGHHRESDERRKF